MSTETAQWLNTMTLIGNTDHRGTAWHYRAELQGDEPNHYPGPVPVADVERRLFSWDAVELPVYVRIPATVEDMDGIDDTGRPFRYLLREERRISPPRMISLIWGCSSKVTVPISIVNGCCTRWR